MSRLQDDLRNLSQFQKPLPTYRYGSFYAWALEEGIPYESKGLTPAEWKAVRKVEFHCERKQ